jgi:uncharacterized membrane protein YedE/YeeE
MAMSLFPLYPADASAAGLSVALGIGIAFGWCLERAGLGSARRLSAQFHGRDFVVLKVMFSAIATAELGVFWLSRLGVLDLSRVYVPETFLAPQAAGGAVFGIGLVMAGLCPGTSCVAAASGRRDGLAVVAGMLAGVLLFAAAFPLVRGFYESTPRGVLTIPDILPLTYGAAVALLVAMALMAFAAAEAIEARAGGRP